MISINMLDHTPMTKGRTRPVDDRFASFGLRTPKLPATGLQKGREAASYALAAIAAIIAIVLLTAAKGHAELEKKALLLTSQRLTGFIENSTLTNGKRQRRQVVVQILDAGPMTFMCPRSFDGQRRDVIVIRSQDKRRSWLEGCNATLPSIWEILTTFIAVSVLILGLIAFAWMNLRDLRDEVAYGLRRRIS
jgi:hypothetical protein